MRKLVKTMNVKDLTWRFHDVNAVGMRLNGDISAGHIKGVVLLDRS